MTGTASLLEQASDHWLLLLLRGLLAVLFGVLTLVYPGSALAALVIKIAATACGCTLGTALLRARRLASGELFTREATEKAVAGLLCRGLEHLRERLREKD